MITAKLAKLPITAIVVKTAVIKSYQNSSIVGLQMRGYISSVACDEKHDLISSGTELGSVLHMRARGEGCSSPQKQSRLLPISDNFLAI